MTQRRRVVLWIGGGSGGHIYPNVAMSQRFAALQRSECADEKPDDMAEIQAHFVVSDRAVDQQVMQGLGLERGRDWTAVEARGFSVRPRAAAGFARGLVKTRATLRALERGVEVVAAVASGGFVSGSVGPSYGMGRGASRGVPMALVSLDAKAGRANRWLARRADQVFSAYDHCGIAGALTIGYPLRDSVMDGAMSAGEARVKLGLDAGRPTLLVFGGSQGGRTLNQAVALAWRGLAGGALGGWQVLHVAGPTEVDAVRQAYQGAQAVRVVGYVEQMQWAWAAADLAICRAGAGSVAEAWAHAVPTVFLPYPFHKDEHQKLNAQPMAQTGGAVIVRDTRDAEATAKPLRDALGPWLKNAELRAALSETLRQTRPADGAEQVARWVWDRVHVTPCEKAVRG